MENEHCFFIFAGAFFARGTPGTKKAGRIFGTMADRADLRAGMGSLAKSNHRLCQKIRSSWYISKVMAKNPLSCKLLFLCQLLSGTKKQKKLKLFFDHNFVVFIAKVDFIVPVGLKLAIFYNCALILPPGAIVRQNSLFFLFTFFRAQKKQRHKKNKTRFP